MTAPRPDTCTLRDCVLCAVGAPAVSPRSAVDYSPDTWARLGEFFRTR